MRSVHLDKIGSVTLNCGLRHAVKVGDAFPCRAGDVIAVQVKNDKPRYNELELVSGRMSLLKSGDVIAGALGHRNASQGYSGYVPKNLKVGDSVNLLNLGGVLGICTSASSLVGEPFECEVLGQVLSFPVLASREGQPATITEAALPLGDSIPNFSGPVIVIVGTNMNSGKTEACLSIIQRLSRMQMRVHAGKVTGVSLRRDVLGMEDVGAEQTAIFTDFGVVTTQTEGADKLARSILSHLAKPPADAVVLELGDGLLGTYGVDRILEDPGFRSKVTSWVLAAGDPVGAWGGVQLLKKYGVELAAVTGPATDNSAGVSAVEGSTGVRAINARTQGDALIDLLLGGAK